MPMNQHAKKRFGQNFLRDRAVIARIIDPVDPRPGQHLLEIGPGRAAITRELLTRAGALDAIELDRDLLPELRRQCEPLGAFRLFNADALTFDYRTPREDERKLRIVGNLPYNISTPLLFHLLEFRDFIEDMHFMLQREVVQRMAATPGSKRWGRLSVMLQTDLRIAPLFDIPARAFQPAPKVESSFVRLTPRAAPAAPIPDRARFDQLVAQAFRHKRKTLLNNLKGLLDAERIRAAGIDPSIRAEQIDIAGFARLAAMEPLEPRSIGGNA